LPVIEIPKTNVFDKLLEAITNLDGLRTLVCYGGAGSSKSYSIAQLLIGFMYQCPGIRVAVGRKTFPSHRTSGRFLIFEILNKLNIYNDAYYSRSDNTYILPNKSNMMFFSLGEGESGVEKIKSADFNIIWLEEATEFDLNDYRQMPLRARSPAVKGLPHNFIILSFNPIDANHWIKTELVDKDPDIIVFHSTYLDNPFLSRDYTSSLEKLKTQDQNYYNIYALGEWGKLENQIFKNYEIIPDSELPIKSDWAKWGYGLDYGHTNPSALVRVIWSGDKLYWQEVIYRTQLTNSNIIELLSHEPRGDIWADSAEPDRIAETMKAGYNCFPANKRIKTGLDVCKRQTIHIPESCINVIKEIRGYSYKKNKDGVVLDEPIEFNDHAMDAGRYGTLGITERYGYATASGSRGLNLTTISARR